MRRPYEFSHLDDLNDVKQGEKVSRNGYFTQHFSTDVRDSPSPPKNISIISYADDFNVCTQGKISSFLSG